jgi:lipid-binding SYLF domain-containing protein
MSASCGCVAGIGCTDVVIITIKQGTCCTTIVCTNIIYGASVSIIAGDAIRGDGTSAQWVTAIGGADIIVITDD